MLSKLKKLSKDLILYSVLVAEFEKLDFKNDALAGVRANYFNAKCSPQTEKTEVTIDNRPYSLSYSMKAGEPASWKITFENRPVQTVKRAGDGSYCVMSYGDNGIIFKRQYFDSSHYWLRTEYYDRARENQMAAVIYPSKHDGLVTLRIQHFTQSGLETAELYPSLKPPKRRCTALIYSNAGMIWYDSAFKPAESAAPQAEEQKSGFQFKREPFRSTESEDVLRLEEAPYLSAEDFDSPAEAPAPVVEEEPPVYSAYDKIEQILFEAQKTNKNIFGELASHAEPEELEKPEETPVEAVADEPEPAPEAEETTAEHEEQVEIANADEPDATSVIATKNGIYLYYGELDGEGKRSGRGRTVTPDGLTSYDGDYSDDKRSGFGVCYYKEGSPNYIGDWKEGSRSGRGVGYRLSDGTMHAGKWLDNKPDGFGARFDSEGNFLDVCSYVDGVRNGKSLSFDEDGNTVVRMWKNGELISEKIISD